MPSWWSFNAILILINSFVGGPKQKIITKQSNILESASTYVGKNQTIFVR